MKISCFINNIPRDINTDLLNFCDEKKSSNILDFHKSLPSYKSTPLVKLCSLADKLGIKNLFVKDESQRFDLNAFKILGASFAMAKILCERININNSEMTFEKIKSNQDNYKEVTFVTATDGNHGRAVAWMAEKFGCKAVVYMPKGSSLARLEAIKSFGAVASITEMNYDDTVAYAEKTGKEKDWFLLQDTAWDGYEEIPEYIMQGYFTLMTECLEDEKFVWPTHVFLQAGVGSLAASLLAFICKYTHQPKPIVVIVEPNGAPCLYESMKTNNGNSFRVMAELNTIMAGLACGLPSSTAFEILKENADAFIKCSDDVTCHGMRVLGKPLDGDLKIISGESGAVTFGVVNEILTKKEFAAIKNDLNLNEDSSILLFSTEGDTDPDAYREIVFNYYGGF